MIVRMFDSLPDVESLADAEDAVVVAAIEGWAQAEAAASARRLAAIAELVRRRCADDDDPRALWCVDMWSSAAAEVGAALDITPRRASSQMHLAQALRTRLPKVGALFLAGKLSAHIAGAIAWRTHLVLDTEAMERIDGDIAQQSYTFGPMSGTKLEQAIDRAIANHDPAALVQFEIAARDRNVEFGKPDDETGTASIWGRLYRTDAEVLDRRLDALARSVCDADPRSIGQRRADAIGAMANRAERLICRCGQTNCSTLGSPAPPPPPVVVHMVAERTAVQAAVENRRGPGAVLISGGVIPTPLLGELIRNGAKLKPLRVPSDDAEPRYRPSAALQDFIRARDLTCRFPGCDTPAEYCDVDHTIPYPAGPTHPSNLSCKCRKHHLLKTFWTGPGGWTDNQLPDGTLRWTSPSGRVYTTVPGSRLFIPAWDTRTAPLSAATAIPRPDGRARKMPMRRRTRSADRAQRIKAERALNNTS